MKNFCESFSYFWHTDGISQYKNACGPVIPADLMASLFLASRTGNTFPLQLSKMPPVAYI